MADCVTHIVGLGVIEVVITPNRKPALAIMVSSSNDGPIGAHVLPAN